MKDGDAELRELLNQWNWRKTVQDYSVLALTFEKDIFSALSGVAKEHKRIRGCGYFAGLWEDSFVKDLLCQRKPPNRTGRACSHPPPITVAFDVTCTSPQCHRTVGYIIPPGCSPCPAPALRRPVRLSIAAASPQFVERRGSPKPNVA